jgi:hypothetical protein
MRITCYWIALLAAVGCADSSPPPASSADAGSTSEEPASPPANPESAPESVFDAIDKALAESDEAAFLALWHPAGYGTNLVGGSGMAGGRFFAQGSRKKWYLKPELPKATKFSDDVRVFPCDIWSREKNRSVDHVHAVIVRREGRWVIVGAGEKREQVDALANRVVQGKELTAPDTEGR